MGKPNTNIGRDASDWGLFDRRYVMESNMDTTIREILEGYFGKGSVEDVIDDLHRQIYKAGIKEVVEWIRENDFYSGEDPAGICIEGDKWQAKLKEWGIDDE